MTVAGSKAPASPRRARARPRRSTTLDASSSSVLSPGTSSGNRGAPNGGHSIGLHAHHAVGQEQRREQHHPGAEQDGHAHRGVDVARRRRACAGRRVRRCRRAHGSSSSCASQSRPSASMHVAGCRARAGRWTHDRDPIEVVVRRRRRDRPLQRADLPGVLLGLLARAHRLQKKFTTKISCAAPSTNAACELPPVQREQVLQERRTGTGRRAAAAARVADQQLPAEHQR